MRAFLKKKKKEKKRIPIIGIELETELGLHVNVFSASLIPGHREQKVSSMSVLLFEMLWFKPGQRSGSNNNTTNRASTRFLLNV